MNRASDLADRHGSARASDRRPRRIGAPARSVAVVATALFALASAGCGEQEPGEDPVARTSAGTSARIERGRALAGELCGTCHQLPRPEILPKAEWRVVLSYMAFFLGQELGLGEGERRYEAYQRSALPSPGTRHDEVDFILKDLASRREMLSTLGLIPETPRVSDERWDELRAYYETVAPEAAQSPELQEALGVVPFFASRPNTYLDFPSTTLVHIDELNQELYIGGMGLPKTRGPRVSVFSPDGEKKREVFLRGVPIGVSITRRGFFLSMIGNFFPNSRNLRPARILFFERDGADVPRVELTDLPRLANSVFGDLDGDGLLDVVTCEHGHGLLEVGAVSLHPGTRSGFGAAQPLIDRPGCVRVDLRDMNGDRKKDVVALMAGAREGLELLINRGGGEFDAREILTEHPAFGYVHAEFADFDGDGDPDVLTVNGDNQDGDLQNRVRHYHGLRIHLNDGTGELSEAYFFHLHGAVMARARDFDRDGDLDIAAISSYPRRGNGEPVSFVYLQNEGGLRFTQWTHDANRAGRWMVMDAGDIDGDADIDIVLGGFSQPVGLVGEIADETAKGKSPAFLILENTR